MFFDFSGAASLFLVGFQAFVILVILALHHHISRLRKQRNALLQEKDIIYHFVNDLSEVFSEADSVDLSALLNRVLSYALRTSRGRAGALYLMESDDETLRVGAVSGVFPPMTGQLDAGMETAFSKIRYVERLVRRQTIALGEGLVGDVAARAVPVLIEDAEDDPRVPRYTQEFLQVHSILLVPMRFRRKVLGVLVVINHLEGKPFVQADLDMLQALGDHASVSIHYAKFGVALDEKRRLDYDLGIAKKIQTALLPKEIPQVPGVELAAFSVPAQQIGGDYYDFVRVDENHLGLAIADVSGKGVSGAIVMSICRSILKLETEGCVSPAKSLRAVNRILSRDLSEDMFVSILYMVLNTQTHELIVARGGHVHPIVCPIDGAEPVIIKTNGIAMGLADAETFDGVLDEKSVQLNPGDMVVVYTDGVTEARDRGGNEWGLLNLVKTIQVTAFEGEGASDAATNIHQKLLQFVGDMPQYDDMTVVAMRTVD